MSNTKRRIVAGTVIALMLAALNLWMWRTALGTRAPRPDPVLSDGTSPPDGERHSPPPAATLQRAARNPTRPTPVTLDLATLRLPRNALAPAAVYLPLATLPDGFTPQVDAALAQREAADKAAADELAALGRGPTHIMAMAADGRGNLWVGSEMQGVYRHTPSTGQWTCFTTRDGLGDNYAYAVAVDRKGRVWVGHLNHGVSVYNGQRWQNYEVVGGISTPTSLSGPLGERIFDIAVCPSDGDVWMASSLGLARYSESQDTWSYYTRGGYYYSMGVPPVPNALGTASSSTGGPPVGADTGKMPVLRGALPSDQANAIAFDADGNIYVGTQCDGLAIALAAENYTTWRVVTGPDRMPTVPRGQGLPTNLINDVLVTRDGTLFVATTLGVAESRDRGRTFTYSRGADWGAKVRGLYGGPPPGWTETPGAMYLEDYVTCLAEGADGLLWVGYRTKGWEAIDPKTGRRPDAVWAADTEFVTSIVPGGGGAYAGTYGQGLIQRPGDVPGASYAQTVAPLPAGASPPTLSDLRTLRRGVMSSEPQADPVVYVGEDWRTQGDWLGRYGRYQAMLAAMVAPRDYVWGAGAVPVRYTVQIGLNATSDDSARSWVHWLYTDARSSLEMPAMYLQSRVAQGLADGSRPRRQAEWDDHGEAYPMSHDGPHLYCRLALPTGLFAISLYFVNKDGDIGQNAHRDYVVSVGVSTDERRVNVDGACDWSRASRCRVVDHRGGVYKNYLVRGPVRLAIKVDRNHSFNTNLNAIMVDQTQEEPSPYFAQPSPGVAAPDEPSALLAALEAGMERSALTWARSRPAAYTMLLRWYWVQSSSDDGHTRAMGTCCYRLGLFEAWEQTQRGRGLRTARDVEQSLKWNASVANASGHGREFIVAATRPSAARQ